MRSILIILATVSVSFLAPDMASAKTEKPNIILVMTDDQGYPPVGRLVSCNA